jgi:hypothetical protein
MAWILILSLKKTVLISCSTGIKIHARGNCLTILNQAEALDIT